MTPLASSFRQIRPSGIAVVVILAWRVFTASAEESNVPPCIADAMIVFDASGSMAGDG
jgi:hypothetical protein